MNIAGDKMLFHIDRIKDHRPITADIFLTNYCNNKCPYCTYRRWELDADAKAITYDEFCRYAEKLYSLGVRGFILTGGGEPTLNPDFLKITHYLEENNLHYGINTNFNNLVACKPDYLKVSLDGYDEDSYERSRGVRKYQQVVKNIQAYAEWKKQYSPKTSLGIQWVATTVDDVNAFYEANKGLDVDYIAYRPFESTGGKYYIADAEKERARDIIAAINALRDKDKRVTLNFKWNMLDAVQDRCAANWAQIALNERGEVMYCCHKPYEIIGNVMDRDILEKKAAAVTNMTMCDVPCRLTAPNDIVRRIEAGRKDDMFI